MRGSQTIVGIEEGQEAGFLGRNLQPCAALVSSEYLLAALEEGILNHINEIIR